jgi:predicted dinucleotide-binding enzyme
MRIGILGTGPVAQRLATRWAAAGHELSFGSRDPESKSLDYPVGSLADTVASAEIVVNATPGAESLRTLTALGADAFAGKTLIDVANASTPAFELMYPNSSLAEKLQEALPSANIVKSMNTAAMAVLTDPSVIGPSTVFVSGNDAGAKAQVTSLLTDFGWSAEAILDLGGIESARGVEHYFLLFFAIVQARKSPMFNIYVVV